MNLEQIDASLGDREKTMNSPKEKRMSLDVGNELYERLQVLAQRQNRSVSDMARILLQVGANVQQRRVAIDSVVAASECPGCGNQPKTGVLYAIAFVGRGGDTVNVCDDCYKTKLLSGEWTKADQI